MSGALGEGAESLGEALVLVPGSGAVPGAVSVAEGEPDGVVLSPASGVVDSVVVGEPVANAAGADRNAAGAMTAVAAATAIARRSFMKTSVKSGCRIAAALSLEGLPGWGCTGEAVDTHR